MPVKNITPADIALVELARGETGAPREVFAELKAKGYVSLTGGKPTLTAKGKTRAAGLKSAEHDLRAMFSNAASGNGRCAITTAAGSTLRG